MDKNYLRGIYKKKRSEMSESDIYELSRIICAKTAQIEEIKTAKNIMLYSDFKNEVCTDTLAKILLDDKKSLFLPIVLGDDIIIGDYISEYYTKNKFGIKEPQNSKSMTVHDMQVCVIPGIVFDKQRHRVGFGKGYYDRFLCGNKKCIKIALAYDYQIVDSIDTDKHDIPMDIIVTEKRVLRG